MSEAKAGGRAWVRELWWIVLLGLVVQGFWAARLQHPAYFDAYYYTMNGQRLAAGQGFTEEIIWQYLDQPQGLPTPSHTYWMPLASLIAAAGYALGGSFRAAQAPFWLMAGLLPLLAYAISWQLYGQRWQARLAALHSKARTSAIVPVDWTRRKYVRKPRGAPPGAVVPQRVKTLFVEAADSE